MARFEVPRVVVTAVESVSDLPDGIWPDPPAPPHLTRARLSDLERDPRFAVRYAVVCAGGRPLLALPAYSPQSARWPDPAYDVSARLALPVSVPARSFCLVGGRADFRCAALEAPGAPAESLETATAAALRQVGAAVAREGRRAALLYADAPDGRLFRAARALGAGRPTTLARRYAIPEVGSDLPGFLTTLSARRRSLVRRDLRDLADSGITARCAGWPAVVADAAPLIADIHNAHDAPDRPALAWTRLQRRAQDPDVEPVAFAVWSAGQLSAVTLGWVHGRTLELYEVGLAAEPAANRGLRYLEVMFYAPLRFMWSRGLRTLDLALGAGRPKNLRGAIEGLVTGLLLPDNPIGSAARAAAAAGG